MEREGELDVIGEFSHASLNFTKDEVEEICFALVPAQSIETEPCEESDRELSQDLHVKRQSAVEANDHDHAIQELSQDIKPKRHSTNENHHAGGPIAKEKKQSRPPRQACPQVSAFSVLKCFDGMGSCSTILQKINRKINHNDAGATNSNTGTNKRRRRRRHAQKTAATTPAKRKKQRPSNRRHTKISPAGRPVEAGVKPRRTGSFKKKARPVPKEDPET